MLDLQQILADARTIAVMGCSADPHRTSHRIARSLQAAGYRILPVNPHHREILGVPCVPDLLHLPADTRLDIVNIFRNPAHTAEMVRQVIAWHAATGQRPVVWTQLGVSSPEAERLAAGAGLPYVRNRCIAVEHRRLVDG